MTSNEQKLTFQLNSKLQPKDADGTINSIIIPLNLGNQGKSNIKNQLTRLKEEAQNKAINKEPLSYYQTTALPQYDKATSLKDKPKVVTELSSEDAFKMFKKRLAELGVTTTWRWEDTKRMLMKEEWAEKLLSTMKERKRAFTEFIADCRQRERNGIREKRQHVML